MGKLSFIAVEQRSPGRQLGRHARSDFLVSRAICFGLTAVLALALTAAVAGTVPKKVLIVHSFGSAAPPFTTHSIAFETELTERIGERMDLDEVSLDHACYADPEMENALVKYLQKRQAKWQPDLVVPIGSPAGIFGLPFL